MLISIDSGEQVKKLPHKKEYDKWRARISDNHFDAIVDELNRRIDSDEVHTAGWMPGSDWDGTVFEPIYFACGRSVQAAGMFFGLIVFKIMMDRDDMWGFGKFEKDGVPIQSMTYFKIKNKIK